MSLTVHVLRAPDYEPDEYFAVCDLLLNMSLPDWTFVIPEVEIEYDDVYPCWGGRSRREEVWFRYHSPVEKIMYEPDRGTPLSWRELFAVCNFYRQMNAVRPTDFVVLLTRRPNALNWFSAFDKQQNVFTHTADWEKFISGDPKYPIAYQVISNVLQLQMSGDLVQKEDCLHKVAIGCMNDFCQNKAQIALKLRTGDICGDCLEKLKAAEVPDVVVDAAMQGFDQLRKQMLFRQGFRRLAKPGPVLVSRHHRILFPEQGNLEAKMPSLARTVYLFFLNHPEGIRLADLCDYRAELMQLYGQTSGSCNPNAMHQSIARLTDLREGTLNQNLSRIRKALTDTLGETLAAPYQIVGEAGERYGVKLERELVRVE